MLSQQHKIWNSIFNNDFSQVLYLFTTPDRQQSKTLILSTKVESKIIIIRVFDCHLLPDWLQMAIKNTVSSDFWSTFVDC